jgi:serpin B
MVASRLSRRDVLKGTAALPAIAGVGALPPTSEPRAVPAESRAQDGPIAALVAGNTTFAFDLYAALRDTVAGNLLVSPYSISQALAMTYAGARGETATQMADALTFTLDQPALHETFDSLNADLVWRGNAEPGQDTAEEARTLRIANALWVEQTWPLIPAYTALLERYYESGIQQADFRNAPEVTREEINTWVEEQTEDRIQDIVPEDAIDAGTKMVLVNAISFFGAWLSAFDPAETRDDAFHLLDGTAVTVPLMYQVAQLRYGQADGYQVVELPYVGSEFAMTVILPDEGRFEEVEAGLDFDMLDTAIWQLAEAEVHVYLPRFTFATETIELKDTMRALGMVDAFDPMRANFSGAAEGGLFITHLLHKAFIGVEENGTEASAATVVIFGSPIAMAPLEVRIDRPFLFAIRDMRTSTVLFLGRVLDPTA